MLGDITSRANALITGDRQVEHGDPRETFARFVGLINTQYGTDFTPADGAVILALLKIARTAHKKSLDSFVDGAGYLDIAGELFGVNAFPASNPRKRQAGR